MQDFGLPDPLINDKMTDISSMHICTKVVSNKL